jgi:23S rRNA (adenine2503-C2)-methyltransferase
VVTLKGQTSQELAELLAPLGVNAGLARKILAAAVRREAHLEDGPGLSAKVLARVREATRMPQLALVERVISPHDGTLRYLFRGEGDEPFETVRIPLLHRPGAEKYIVCVSSQVGCAMKCEFCATGRMGWQRDLATWEMVDQVLRVRAESDHPIGGVVFMGMGEPLLNADAVIRAAKILSEPCGGAIAAKAITISTVGVVPGIRRFITENFPFRLVVSLTSADPGRRRALMPAEEIWPATAVVAALREYHQVTRRRVTLAWTMIAGVNTSREDARQLAALTRGLPIKLDLIDVNDPTGRFCPPGEVELNAFRDALRAELGMPIARRYSGGQDIQAACGLLAGGPPRAVPGRGENHGTS